MKEIIPKYFFSKSKCLIIVKSILFRQGCAELLRIPGGFWLKKQTLGAAAVAAIWWLLPSLTKSKTKIFGTTIGWNFQDIS